MNNRRLTRRTQVLILIAWAILICTGVMLMRPGVTAGPGVPNQLLRAQFVQGSLESTGVNTDVAIQGPGFFRVKVGGDGTAYTRNGEFLVNNKGQLLVAVGQGCELSPPITIPNQATHLQISQNGMITATIPGATGPILLGQFELNQFANQQGLRSLGDGLYNPTRISGPPVVCKPGDPGAGQLMQDFLEVNSSDHTPSPAIVSQVSWMRGRNE
jgi:flagellar basal-body rod protein FlgG